MSNKPTELTEFFLLEEERNRTPEDLTLLINKIVHFGLTISSHVKKVGLSDMSTSTGTKNIHKDEVIKLDNFANSLITEGLSSLEIVYGLGSEEIEDFRYINKKSGKYIVFFDPLDGSSNTEANIPIGTIFSIYKNENGDILPIGKKQLAAGYILYGSSVMLVYTTGKTVNGFTLDPGSGVFCMSHPNLKLPENGKIYSANEARFLLWDKRDKLFIENLKKEDKYSLRYVGSMVADIHRTLIKGGVFLYPSDTQNPKGKLRLMFEVNPMSFLVETAGGRGLSNGVNPLEIKPSKLHEKASIILGSKFLIDKYKNL